MHDASPLAHRLWYFVRALGRAKHPPGWYNEHHGRDGFILHVVQRGALNHEIGQTRYTIRTGEACLLDLRYDLRYKVTGTSSAEFYWAWINGKDMPTVFLELGADQDPIFLLANMPRTVDLLRELRTLTVRKPPSYEVRSSGLITLILSELFSSRAERVQLFTLGASARPLSDPVRRAIHHMTRYYDSALAVKQIASGVANLSLSHFSRLFHQEVGVSPIVYLNRFRIEQARKFLTGSSQGVAQIARSVGYQNPHYFTRTFVRIVGVTPREYRKNPVASRPVDPG